MGPEKSCTWKWSNDPSQHTDKCRRLGSIPFIFWMENAANRYDLYHFTNGRNQATRYRQAVGKFWPFGQGIWKTKSEFPRWPSIPPCPNPLGPYRPKPIISRWFGPKKRKIKKFYGPINPLVQNQFGKKSMQEACQNHIFMKNWTHRYCSIKLWTSGKIIWKTFRSKTLQTGNRNVGKSDYFFLSSRRNKNWTIGASG